MIYCILGMIMLFGNSEANITTQKKHISSQSVVSCDLLSNTHVICGMFPGSKKYTPIEDIPKSIKIFESILMYPESFLKISPTIFHGFPNLTEIRLVGILFYFQASSVDTIGVQRREVIENIVDLPNLKLLSVKYWRMDDFHVKLPAQLETVSLQKCNISELDLTMNQNLISLDAVANNLKKMPRLSNPPPPLKRLVLSGNPDLEFSVFDIIDLCHLKYLGVSEFNANLDQMKKYCECLRLKEYMLKFDIVEHEFISCDNSNSMMNCIDYPSSEPIQLHDQKCGKWDADKILDDGLNTPESWLTQYRIQLGLVLLFVCSALANAVLIVALYNNVRNSAVEDANPSVFEEEVEI